MPLPPSRSSKLFLLSFNHLRPTRIFAFCSRLQVESKHPFSLCLHSQFPPLQPTTVNMVNVDYIFTAAAAIALSSVSNATTGPASGLTRIGYECGSRLLEYSRKFPSYPLPPAPPLTIPAAFETLINGSKAYYMETMINTLNDGKTIVTMETLRNSSFYCIIYEGVLTLSPISMYCPFGCGEHGMCIIPSRT